MAHGAGGIEISQRGVNVGRHLKASWRHIIGINEKQQYHEK